MAFSWLCPNPNDVGLVSHLRRAAFFVPSSIAEGYGRDRGDGEGYDAKNPVE